ncbi:MAG: hypothetical protein R3B68_08500 [Phycisphaerales bacterium]
MAGSGMTGLVRTLIAALVAIATLAMASASFAIDRVTLTTGEVLEGTIERELSGYVWMKVSIGGIEQSRTLAPEDIRTIERDAGGGVTDPAPARPGTTTTGGSNARPGTDAAPATPVDDDSVVKGVVLSLGGPEGDMVGLYMAAKPLREVMQDLIDDGVDVVVFHVESGGGMLIEIEPLVETIREYKEHFRVVAWIDRAISAAAMTSHVVEDIYFKSHGTYGACTGFNGGNLQAITGRPLEEVLYFMERVSDWGNKSPYIMRSMQINEPLSADIDENGDVHWYQSLDGEYVVSDGEFILTFTSDQAEDLKFSRGTADTLDELTAQLGMGEIHWLGTSTQGSIYPISEEEQHQIDFRLMVQRAEQRMGEFFAKYQMARGAISGDRQTRAAMGQRALAALDEVRRLVENNPNFALMQFGFDIEQFREWYRNQVEEVRRLMR